ncbi:MAG: LTA synthase family protein [Bacteroidetes bacterium]|nr:LTA synthase family protein [Bacteroidota bacterium]
MKHLLLPLKRLAEQIILLLGLFFLSRICFTLINLHSFDGLRIRGFFRLAFFALRYDLSAICMVNALYFLLLLLPLPKAWLRTQDRCCNAWFILSNSLAFLFEIADWAYFPYNFKRSTADVLHMVSRPGDFWSLLPSYLIEFWYIPIGMAAFIFLLIKWNCSIRKRCPIPTDTFHSGRRGVFLFLGKLLLLLVVAGGTLIGIRGGLQYIPIGLRNAVQVTESRYVPVVLNTPFSILSTLMTPALKEVHYLPDAEATQEMPFRHRYNHPFQKKNVVLIILESESKEFTALGTGPSFTPFLDSLMGQSLTCTQAFANGQTSAEGIPAILAGIPTLMDEAFTTSNYGANRLSALPGLLRAKGYSSAFYHGGTNGTMSFDVFASAAGMEHYYGRNEYGDERDYDGAWGIRDEPFLQYFARGLASMKQPFIASVFTLSAHPPYSLPERYKQTLPKGPLPVQQCIAYTDQALRRFFQKAATETWYNNTLFVITADHCSPQNGGGYYDQGMGRYAIPVLFFCPTDSSLTGYFNRPMQQIDILPSVLEYLGYDQPFFAFGNSIFGGDTQRYVITQSNGSYQWLEQGRLLQTQNMKPQGYFQYPQDSLCLHPLNASFRPQQDTADRHLKAFVQRYRQALIHNALF